MTGRGIDQIQASPGSPELFESWVTDARDYVRLAERRNGPIHLPVSADYIWGSALAELNRFGPEVRIANLETSITTCNSPWPGKGIHYRMNPANADCLAAAKLDVCALANNHVLDWSHEGLYETLAVLRNLGIRTPGAGLDEQEATAPATLALPGGGRMVIVSCGLQSSGIPNSWSAGPERGGVFLLPDLTQHSLRRIGALFDGVSQPGDIRVVSVHWGDNWGYDISPEQQAFARQLVDQAGVDLVHGHSSHHPRGAEVWNDRLILYGCGDLINDYEGIGGYESFHPDLSLLYLITLDRTSGALLNLTMPAMRIRRFQVHRADQKEISWLAERLTLVSRQHGVAFRQTPSGDLELTGLLHGDQH
ncbi:poly-gamma-glutamate biosynthesis protein [Marinobacter salinus]|uniref:Poly-gamma-glutamate biosynthesis protein n=2 Tax=Marinobacter salinus TaxID=1874317 RepID=A0A1D9GJ26_9GAMM|nr:poly-gamma-glutamate biosynthesis protein [Marinobacter salinus]